MAIGRDAVREVVDEIAAFRVELHFDIRDIFGALGLR